ncbi:hypothetical protein LEP1GSC024_0274 [Leptospira noguchii str. 2001034031]|uniref:Uncharacterized protein n=1 Tax=Leptospira noguchii str. 2001034031 TaxID=1193053 RepID=M6Y0P7_9LEPT|nr:hypothetical protein LEP1GSC024_0274 [Leptospira noguchii str. 2001034031]
MVNPEVSEMEKEELVFQERIEIFWKAFQKMSSSEKRKEVNRLFSTFNKYHKRMEILLFQWKDLFEKEREGNGGFELERESLFFLVDFVVLEKCDFSLTFPTFSSKREPKKELDNFVFGA